MAICLPRLRHLLLAAFCGVLASCGAGDDGTIDVALIGQEEAAYADGLRLDPAAQLVRGATESGLVSFNGRGEIVPALAERWVPTDEGRSFFFRLREGTWPDGKEITASSARAALLSALGQLEGTSLGQDLSVVQEVRAMTDRVLEVRLSAPEPYLLQLLAQPELALRHPGGGTGPMILAREEDATMLTFKPPEARGEPMREDWQDHVRTIDLRVTDASSAIDLFDAGEVAVVLGGDLGNFPLVETGPLSTGTLRVDTSYGLFGLQVMTDSGLLADSGVREGIAMAIDRQALIAGFNIGGWLPSTRPVSAGLPGDQGLVPERWTGRPIEDLRAEALGRVRLWRARNESADISQPAQLRIYVGQGPGWDILYRNLAGQMAQIDIALVRADNRSEADLALVDRIARYPAPRWFLNQFNCALRSGLCSEGVDALVAEASLQSDPAQRAVLMAQAEAELTLENIFIPFGTPLRWSLVRGSVDGFMGTSNAFHPLPDLAQIPR